MGNLSSIYIKRETLKTLLDVVSKKNEKGIEITVSTNDESNDYGQNVTAYVAQTKEQREAGKKKFYVANGKVFWTDGKIVVGKKSEVEHVEVEVMDEDDLPF